MAIYNPFKRSALPWSFRFESVILELALGLHSLLGEFLGTVIDLVRACSYQELGQANACLSVTWEYPSGDPSFIAWSSNRGIQWFYTLSVL